MFLTGYTRHLDGYGVNRSAVLKYDRSDFLERVEKEIQNNESYDLDWYKHKLNDKKDTEFDLFKFKKRSLHALDSMAKKLDSMGGKDLAQKVREQKQEFVNLERDNIGKVIDNTMQILEKDDKKWREYCENSFRKTLGTPADYTNVQEKIEQNKEKMIEKYQSHLEKTKEDLEELFFKTLSDEMENRKEKAIAYIDKKLVELDKRLGRDPRDDSFCRERER